MNNEELKLQQIKLNLTEDELLELKYMYALGMKWIAKDEDELVTMLKIKPYRLGDSWYNEALYEEDFEKAKLSNYNWLTWEDEPIEIEKLIK